MGDCLWLLLLCSFPFVSLLTIMFNGYDGKLTMFVAYIYAVYLSIGFLKGVIYGGK